MTPVQLEVLIHYYYKNELYDIRSVAVEEAESHLESLDLIVHKDAMYRATKKGAYMVKHGLCKVPIPEMVYLIPTQ